jgi:hypothetical protein
MVLASELTWVEAWLSLWAFTFVLGFLLIALEGLVFMEEPEIRHAVHLVAGLCASGVVEAAAVALGTMAAATDLDSASLAERARAFFATRPLLNWSARFLGAAVAYMVAYMVIGSATWPFIRRFYTDPRFGLRLRIPGPFFLIGLQGGRGLATTAVLVPIVVATTPRDVCWCAKLALMLAATLGLAPLLLAHRWPWQLRLAHAAEITVFAIPYALTVWLLIAPQT